MKRMNWFICSASLAVLLVGSSLQAQPYYLRGDFNNWGTTAPMTDNGDGSYSATVSGTPGTRFDFKIAVADWSLNWPGSNARSLFDASGSFTANFRPGSNARSLFDASGSFTANFRPGSVADGWNPGSNRVGYRDPAQFGWEIMGSFNGWSSPVVSLTPMGGGLYSGELVASAGSYAFKFREAGSWNISIGGDFGNAAANNHVTTTPGTELIQFQLDLPNGRWSATVVPEPASFGLLLLGGALLAWRPKRNGR